jgi:hypothetical protein
VLGIGRKSSSPAKPRRVAFFLLPKAGEVLADPNLPRNVNDIFGMDDALPQTWMSAELYLVT